MRQQSFILSVCFFPQQFHLYTLSSQRLSLYLPHGYEKYKKYIVHCDVCTHVGYNMVPGSCDMWKKNEK